MMDGLLADQLAGLIFPRSAYHGCMFSLILSEGSAVISWHRPSLPLFISLSLYLKSPPTLPVPKHLITCVSLFFSAGMIVFPSRVCSVTPCSLMCFPSLRLLCQPPVAGEQVSILSGVPPTHPHTALSRRLTELVHAERLLAR